MEKSLDETKEINAIEEEPQEIILYQESSKNEEERIENSVSDIEEISREEYLLECARYGEIDDLRNLIEESKNINYNLDINYLDFKKNSALRK